MIPPFIHSFFIEEIYLFMGLTGIFIAFRYAGAGTVRYLIILGSISMLSRVIIIFFYNYSEVTIHYDDGWVVFESIEEFFWYFALKIGVPLSVLLWGVGLLILLKKSKASGAPVKKYDAN